LELRFKLVDPSAKGLVLRGEDGDRGGLLSVLSEDNFKTVDEIVEPFKEGLRTMNITSRKKLALPTVNAGIHVPRVGPLNSYEEPG